MGLIDPELIDKVLTIDRFQGLKLTYSSYSMLTKFLGNSIRDAAFVRTLKLSLFRISFTGVCQNKFYLSN